jgi:1-acyl-sn-glycerol-3-phosphate acyltransferase
LYRLVRGTARLGLHLFFRHIEVEGAHHVPADGPVLLACNHPNALVDPLLPLVLLRRRVTLTAKNVLARNPLRGWLMSALGVIPFHRREDLAKGARPRANLDSMRRCREILAAGGCLCLFPEGTSHSDRRLRPLRPGMARLLTEVARHGGHAGRLCVVPVGLLYTEKDRFRSGARVRFGAPIEVARWLSEQPDRPAAALTALIERRLEALTVNHASRREALFVQRAAALLAATPPGTATSRLRQPVRAWFDQLARLQTGYRCLLEHRPHDLRALHDRLRLFRRRLRRRGLRPSDVDAAGGMWDLVREVVGLLAVAPPGLLGVLLHLPGFLIVRRVARHLSRDKDHWASYSLYPGALIVPLVCLLQVAAACLLLPAAWAAAYSLGLPLCGNPAVVLRDRACAVGGRIGGWVRSWRRGGRDPRLRREVRWLRARLREVEVLGRLAGTAHDLSRRRRLGGRRGLPARQPAPLSLIASQSE